MYISKTDLFQYGQCVKLIYPLSTNSGTYDSDSYFRILEIPLLPTKNSIQVCTLIDQQNRIVHNVPMSFIVPEYESQKKELRYIGSNVINRLRVDGHIHSDDLYRTWSPSKTETFYKYVIDVEKQYRNILIKRKKYVSPYSHDFNVYPVFFKLNKQNDNSVLIKNTLFTDIDIVKLDDPKITEMLKDKNLYISKNYKLSSLDFNELSWPLFGGLDWKKLKKSNRFDFSFYIKFPKPMKDNCDD